MRSLRLLAVLVSLACAFAAAACGGGGAGSETGPLRLFPFRYVSGTGDYVYSLGSPDSIPIQLHRDVDPSRFAMTYGDGVSWLFLGKPGSDDLILFRYSAGAGAYVEAAAEPRMLDAPADADLRRVAALFDGTYYRLYARSLANPATVYQWRSPDVMGDYTRTSSVSAVDGPADADYDRFTFYHDGSTYRQAVHRSGSADTMYQFGYTGGRYDYGYNSRDVIRLVGIPTDAHTEQVSILHDGDYYRAYLLSR